MGGLICPKCKVAMQVKKANDVEVIACPQCEGIWVDQADEKQVLAMKPQVFSVDELRRLRKVYQPQWRAEEVRYFECPRCQNLMWRKNYMTHSGIIVDKCDDHGAFFDKGELEKAMEFIQKGGMEYEKLKLTERGLSQLQTQIDKVSDKVERVTYKLPWLARLLLYLGY